MSDLTCGFIGLGLIGGSIAHALKEIPHKEVTIIAYDVNADSLLQAQKEKIVDKIAPTIDASFSSCDYLFLCAPVEENDKNLLLLKNHLSPTCILTDVGSVKAGIHLQIEAVGLTSQFIGGHPMAGSERTGYQNSKARILENAYYILTPCSEVPQENIKSYSTLVEEMGAIPLLLTPSLHDYVTAAISHLPHVLASSLVNLVKKSDSKEGIMKLIAAGGFKDFTRIASSSPQMWQQICLNNTMNISSLLEDYISELLQIKKELDAQNAPALYNFFDDARIYRDSFLNTSSGPLKISYALNVDIADEPGALASIATMLALNSISIKNIGIIHNRELEEGSLRIEFYEESAMYSAKTILLGKGYTIHEKK